MTSGRSGFVIGEGAAVVMLESEEHAPRNAGQKSYGEICGYGNTCDAFHITAPDPSAESGARSIRLAMEEAGYTASADRVYINAHGTGTQLNDGTETLAIKKALGSEAAKRRAMISSTKSMTGHMLGAAGAAECIAGDAGVATRACCLPPSGLTEPDPDCDLDYIPLEKREAQCDLALNISLGFGGHNACVSRYGGLRNEILTMSKHWRR